MVPYRTKAFEKETAPNDVVTLRRVSVSFKLPNEVEANIGVAARLGDVDLEHSPVAGVPGTIVQRRFLYGKRP